MHVMHIWNVALSWRQRPDTGWAAKFAYIVWALTSESEDFVFGQAISVRHVVGVLVEEQLVHFWLHKA